MREKRKWLVAVLLVLLGFGLGNLRYLRWEKEVGETESKEKETRDTSDEILEKPRVVKVTDGDTIKVKRGEETATVRLIGIDAPEVTKVECYGKEATEKLVELVLDKEVILERDRSETDRYGRELAYVWLGEIMVNEAMVKMGYARAYPYLPDTRYSELFEKAEEGAREKRRGLWDKCESEKLSEIPTAEVKGESSENDKMETKLFLEERKEEGLEKRESIRMNDTSDATNAEECLIKGNISSGGKIYHNPGCGSYEKTVIDTSSGERWFCSEEEAEDAGWRKAKNC